MRLEIQDLDIYIYIYIGTTPQPVTVTTRILPFLVGNPYKASFVTVTGWGVDLISIYYIFINPRKYVGSICIYLNAPKVRCVINNKLA